MLSNVVVGIVLINETKDCQKRLYNVVHSRHFSIDQLIFSCPGLQQLPKLQQSQILCSFSEM